MAKATSALRALRDVGGAAWLGGSLMGAAGLNAAADAAGDPETRERVVTAGWSTWTPIFRAAALTHLVGSIGLLAQKPGAGKIVGLGLTGAALGATVGAGMLGSKGASKETIHAVEWAVPALLAGSVVAGATNKR
jgi:hypothetical protein